MQTAILPSLANFALCHMLGSPFFHYQCPPGMYLGNALTFLSTIHCIIVVSVFEICKLSIVQMEQPPKIRRACDRCHTQKLRCKRIEGHHTCVRCGNANLTCIFSPPGKNQKQHLGRKQSVGAASNRQKSTLSSTHNDSVVASNGLIGVDKRPADCSQLPPVTALQQWPTSQPEDEILLNCKYSSSFICCCINIGHWIEEMKSNSDHSHIPQSTKN